jgi:hypothetical protein
MSTTKEIILKYNDYEIPIKISKDFEQCKEEIKKKLYLKDLNSDKWSLFYYDEDEYENDIDEDCMDEAFEAKIWGLTQEEKTDDDHNKVNSEEIKKKINKKVRSEQKAIDEKINKIKQEITEKLTKAFTERISACEKKIEQLKEINKSLKEKNKKIIEEMTKFHESSIQDVLNKVKSYSQERIGAELDNYNKMFKTELSSTIDKNKSLLEKQNTNIKNMFSSLSIYKNNLQNTLEQSKNNFSEVYSQSMQNINLNHK